jgi:hypothetical protein
MQTGSDETWNTIIMASIAGALAYMAFGTWWHAGLFAFIGFTSHAVGNRLSRELSGIRNLLRQFADDQARR